MCFEIYSRNLVDQATLVGSNENALFPVENIQDQRRSKVFRSTTNSDNVVFDFQETSEIGAIFVVADKRNGFGLSTITFEFNGTNSWGAPAATESFTFSNTFDVGFKELAATLNYRFCRMVMTSTLGYCEVANVFIGKKIDLDRSVNFGWSYQDRDNAIERVNRYGQIFADRINRSKVINASMSLLTKDQMDEFFDAYDRCGETLPLFLKIGVDGSNTNDHRRYSGMYFFNDMPSITNTSFNRYGMSLSFIEAT